LKKVHGRVRFETYRVSAYLVWMLKFAGVHVIEDGGDIILTQLASGEKISIHLIESSIELYEIKNTLAYNGATGVYTLFLFWADLLLPDEGHVVEPYQWERALLALYGDRIYAYEIFGSEVFVFPVHFEREGVNRHIRYGNTVSLKQMICQRVEGAPYLSGFWNVAAFAERRAHGRAAAQDAPRPTAPPHTGIERYFDVLELSYDAELDAVKIAYRRLARKYHPDLNPAANATERMQAINEAYQKIVQYFEDQPA
jgi:hypothetical protein